MSNVAESAPSFLPGASTVRARPLGALLSISLRRRGGRRATSAFVVVLFLAGVGMFATPAITDLYATVRQHVLQSKFNSPQFKTIYRSGQVPIGDGLTELEIHNSRVQVNVLVVQGTTPAALEAGAGHYVNTPLPCYQGNVGIAGHRTTFGRPFNKIDEMRAGDTVTLVTPIGQCVYQVTPSVDGHSNPWIVEPNDFNVVSQSGVLGSGHWLTLTSCNPPGSATQRIVLRLKMISSTVVQPTS